MWNLILQQPDWNIIDEFVKNNLLTDEIDDFFEELNNYEIISYNNTYDDILGQNTTSSNAVFSTDLEEAKQFLRQKKEFLYKNHFLYSLTINIDETINNTDKIIKIISEVKAIGTNLITLNIINSSFGEDFFKIAKFIRKNYLPLEIKFSLEALNCKDSNFSTLFFAKL